MVISANTSKKITLPQTIAVAKPPVISIIIPTLNEEGFIEKILEDIVQQNADYEVIIADSGSSDQTEKSVKSFAARYPEISIQFLHAAKKGVSIARNTGAEQAKGEYILFLDADTRIPPDFLKNTLNEMKERNLDAAGCYLLPNSTRLLDKTVFYLHHHLILNPLQYTKRPGAAGAGIIVKKAVHDQVYGFDENFTYNEDLEYVKKIGENRQFRMLKSTKVLYSTRRFDQEGRHKVWFKYIVSGLCYLLNLKYIQYEYEFGKFSKNNIEERFHE